MSEPEKTAISRSISNLDGEKNAEISPEEVLSKEASQDVVAADDRNSANSSVHTTLSHPDTSFEELELGRVTTTSTINPPPVSVPLGQRRGLLAQLAIIPEVEQPKHYARKTKWFITFVIGVAAMAAPMGSAIFFPALGQVAESLHASPTITNLSVALYMLSMAIFPLWWSSFSERLGRRTIYLFSFALFVLWSALSAISKSISMLIVMRMLGGGASASVQAVGAGTIADLWEVKERGRAMGIFYLGPLCGPLLAPIIGGILAEEWGWRSTQWFLVIYGSVTFMLLLFCLPETLVRPKKSRPEPEAQGHEAHRSLSRVSSRQVVQATARWLKVARIVLIDPLKVLLYLRFPPVLLTVYYGSIAFGSLFLLNISVQYTFSRSPYNFSTLIVGLLYIPNSIGYLVSSFLGGRWMDRIMLREARKANRVDERGKLIYRPEDRMRENAWLGALLYPIALIMYGWTAEKKVYWAVPVLTNFFFGVGSMLVFSMSTTMLTEFMPKRSSSGVAVNNFARNIFSCVGSIVAAPIIHGIGNGWLFTIVGLVAIASSSVIWAMKKYGPKWRASMDAKLG